MNKLVKLLRLMQLSDSAFPIGAFSFSNGLEAAVSSGIVCDVNSLEQYVESIVFQGVHSDAIAMLHSLSAAQTDDYEMIGIIDEYLLSTKLNEEALTMSSRMGKKLAEISIKLFDNELLIRWLADIRSGKVNGLYPVTFGIVARIAGFNAEEAFASYYYGMANMVLSATLRCMRVSHYDTQQILLRIIGGSLYYYNDVCNSELSDIFSFTLQVDILASLHQKGHMRMFMN